MRPEMPWSKDVYHKVPRKRGLYVIATYCFDCCFFLITFVTLNSFVLSCDEWCC